MSDRHEGHIKEAQMVAGVGLIPAPVIEMVSTVEPEAVAVEVTDETPEPLPDDGAVSTDNENTAGKNAPRTSRKRRR